MLTKDKILEMAKEKDSIKTSDLSVRFDISRQFANSLIGELVDEGKLIKIGKTRGAHYILPGKEPDKVHGKKRLKNDDLKEHEIFDEFGENLPFIEKLPNNTRSILDYAFSEMLNNAIEHSKSKNIEVEIWKDNKKGLLHFIVNDFGVGVFRNVMKDRKLNSELEAIQDLLKGKTTTQPHAHSGEGIFFTSKVADIFSLKSFDYGLRIDNTIDDVFVEEIKPSKKGTIVEFVVNIGTERRLSDIFRKYQTDPDAMSFDKTEIKVRLYITSTVYVSRSQARRLLAGLDKFKSIILDFDRVPTIGQAFADEVFRVFKERHPDIAIRAVNANEAVQFMINRSQQTER